MADSPMSHIAGYYRSRHELILKIVAGLDEGQFLWRPNRTAPSIAFHVWHVARWADYLQAVLSGSGVEIWEQEGLAARWGFRAEDLGMIECLLGLQGLRGTATR